MKFPSIVILIGLIAAGCGTTSPAVSEDPNDLHDLPNFAQVSPILYRGAQPTAQGFRDLQNMGIKTIVNLRTLHDDREALAGTNLKYIRIPCNAWHPEDEDVKAFLQIMNDPANYPVFVHCQQGADRTGLMVAVYRIADQGWSNHLAIAELPTYGFHPIFADIDVYLTHFRKSQPPFMDEYP